MMFSAAHTGHCRYQALLSFKLQSSTWRNTWWGVLSPLHWDS